MLKGLRLVNVLNFNLKNMGIANQIFQKNLAELTFADLVDFFKEGRQETSTLEFKSGGSEVESVTQEVCAFLNTDGGIIIYGSPREKDIGNGKKMCIGDLVPTKKIRNKLTLGSTIAANISPSPSSIAIQQIDVQDAYIFIIEVPKSVHPPHQVSSQGKYYIRLDTEAKAAPHGFVEAMFFKRQKPNLDLSITVAYNPKNNKFSRLLISLNNDSDFTAESIGYVYEIYGIEEKDNYANNVEVSFEYEKRKLVCRSHQTNPVIVRGIVLDVEIYFVPILISSIVIKCLIWCKDMSARTYYFSFNPLNFKQPEELYYSEIDKTIPDFELLLAPYYMFLRNHSNS